VIPGRLIQGKGLLPHPRGAVLERHEELWDRVWRARGLRALCFRPNRTCECDPPGLCPFRSLQYLYVGQLPDPGRHRIQDDASQGAPGRRARRDGAAVLLRQIFTETLETGEVQGTYLGHARVASHPQEHARVASLAREHARGAAPPLKHARVAGTEMETSSRRRETGRSRWKRNDQKCRTNSYGKCDHPALPESKEFHLTD